MEKEESWNFKGENTKDYTHGFHTYPAMMIPQIVRRLIYMYGKDAKILLDPFCGSGTSLVEASLTNNIKKVYGFDLNPLTIKIASAKITPLNPSRLQAKLYDLLERVKNNKEDVQQPNFKNISFWFKEDVIKKLARLKKEIDRTDRTDVRNFFEVIFSEIVRKVSNARNSEFKLYKMNEEKLKKFSPDVYKIFEEQAEKNIKGMGEYVEQLKKIDRLENNRITSTLQLLDTRNPLPIKENSINLIITSPPYGDSKTTVAYGQFSRLALQWLGYKEINDLDNKLLGGKASKELEIKIDSKTLKEIIKKIAEKDEKRAREVLSFYEDFDKCIIQLDKVMAKNGYVCFVVGNRTVKGINIPTDKIMIEMFHSHGNYIDIATHKRDIPNKRMPSMTSPTNKVGALSPTMSKEYIFILKKI